MQKDHELAIGDKIDITTDRRRFFKSMITDVYGNGLFLIGAPIHRGYQMKLQLYEEVFLVFYRDSGRFITKMRVVDFRKKDDIVYTILQQLTVPEKNQRREFYRLRTSGEVKIIEYKDGAEVVLAQKDEVEDAIVLADGSVKDLSVSGIAVHTRRPCSKDEKFVLKMSLHATQNRPQTFFISARVVRIGETAENNVYDIGMRFFGLTREKRDFLSKFIISQQQRKIKQVRLIEGE